MLTVSQLIPVLQVAIGPVVLVSGVGLLILSMTNRLGRIIDRGRSLVRELPNANEVERDRLRAQLDILWVRARLMRRAILWAAVCVLLAAVLVITLFVTAAFQLEDAWLIGLLFTGAMVSLILSLTTFIQDLNRSLAAFQLVIQN